jgi:hypothetical protein
MIIDGIRSFLVIFWLKLFYFVVIEIFKTFFFVMENLFYFIEIYFVVIDNWLSIL